MAHVSPAEHQAAQQLLEAIDLVIRQEAARGRDHDLVHSYDTCCEPFDRYVCGTPVPPNDRVTDEPVDCVVCVELLDAEWALEVPCRRCGLF